MFGRLTNLRNAVVLLLCVFLGSCWIAERPTDPEHRARAYVPEHHWSNFIDTLRENENIDRVIVSDHSGIIDGPFEGQRAIAITLLLERNLTIYMMKSLSSDMFSVSTNYNILRSHPNDEYICRQLEYIRDSISSLHGEFIYEAGPCGGLFVLNK